MKLTTKSIYSIAINLIIRKNHIKEWNGLLRCTVWAKITCKSENKNKHFNRHNHGPEESAESCITAVHSLVEHCAFRHLREELIRGRTVAVLRCKTLMILSWQSCYPPDPMTKKYELQMWRQGHHPSPASHCKTFIGAVALSLHHPCTMHVLHVMSHLKWNVSLEIVTQFKYEQHF